MGGSEKNTMVPHPYLTDDSPRILGRPLMCNIGNTCGIRKKVQVGKDQEKAQSEKDSHSKNRGGKKPN